MWTWLQQGRRALVLVEAAIIIGLGVGLNYSSADPAAWGSVLVLGITAMVAAWYADETRLMAQATREMARCALLSATAQCGADLVLRGETRGLSRHIDGRDTVWTHVNAIVNCGAGPAFGIRIGVHGGEPTIKLPELRPRCLEQLPSAPEFRENEIEVTYRDVIKEHRDIWVWAEERLRWERRE